ncbi:MAG: hypothetical protein IKO05_04290 [Selenomonadaceae bacterium]|nr:hypothetical protein [Selenomonadaceae bacterium]
MEKFFRERVVLGGLMNDFYFLNQLFFCLSKRKVAKEKDTSQGRGSSMIRSRAQPVPGVRRMTPSRRQTRRGRHP